MDNTTLSLLEAFGPTVGFFLILFAYIGFLNVVAVFFPAKRK